MYIKLIIVYTGPIDEFFNCDEGRLEWRSLRFEHERINNLEKSLDDVVQWSLNNPKWIGL